MSTDNKIEKILAGAKIKATKARHEVLLLLYNHQGHYSAEEIHQKLSSIGLATIYRTLVQLEAVGLILRHIFMDGVAVYEINDGDHGHAVCLECGNILEFDDKIINQRQAEIAEELKLNTLRISHTIYGRCHNCSYSSKD